MKLFTFALYRNGVLVGYENHGIDSGLAPLIGVYHLPLGSSLKLGNPITMGAEKYIYHDRKTLIFIHQDLSNDTSGL